MGSIARFETLTRIGFAARGLTYILIGWLALRVGQSAGASDALGTLADSGGGRLVLILCAVGLFAYGAWRLLEAALDLEGAGDDAKGTAVRAGHGLSGAAHLFLGFTALELALGAASGGGGDGETARAATSWVLTLPAGSILVRLVAAVLMLAGAFQIVEAIQLKFLKQLEPGAAAKGWVKWVGRLGYIARGIVFLLVGLSFWRASSEGAGAAGGTGEALGSLSGTSQAVVAAGLLLFGLFSLVQAAYRRITDPRVAERLRARL
ncbi:MAG: DUF1206 domain-containing protein [Sphingomonadaceae bacterium]|nr:DUF1206 domain-containing protein [Sphingomonadaceae bacterium]